MTEVQTERLRDYFGPATNTNIWDDFKLGPDDIVVNTPPKCGTTWMLNIVMMLVYWARSSRSWQQRRCPLAGCGVPRPEGDCYIPIQSGAPPLHQNPYSDGRDRIWGGTHLYRRLSPPSGCAFFGCAFFMFSTMLRT
jgi:hypothetical protein